MKELGCRDYGSGNYANNPNWDSAVFIGALPPQAEKYTTIRIGELYT